MSTRYIVDTSALVRFGKSPSVKAVLAPLITQKSVALCTPTLLESMYTARATEYSRSLRTYRDGMTILPITAESCERAEAVQELLARTSQHRTAKVIDLLIAACAEINRLTVLHYDKDFDAIAKVTGQPAMWVVPAGTVP